MEYRSSKFLRQLNHQFLRQLFFVLPAAALPLPLVNLLFHLPDRVSLTSVISILILAGFALTYFIADQLSFNKKTYAIMLMSLAQSIALMFANMELASFAFWLFAYTLSSLAFGLKASAGILLTTVPIFAITLTSQNSIDLEGGQLQIAMVTSTFFAVMPFIVVMKFFREFMIGTDLNQQQELHTLKKEMHSQTKILRSVINSGPVRMFWKDTRGYYLGCNKQFAQDVGLSDEKLISGLKASDLFGVDRGKQLENDDQRVMSLDRQQPAFENRTFNEQGEERWLLTSKNRFVDDEDNLLGTCAYYFDITSLKMVESQLIHSRAIAESSNRAKSQFLINISHEFRTFSNSIMGMSQGAMRQTLNQDLIEQLENIYQSSKRLLSLTNDILDYSHVESGKIYLERTPYALRKLAEELNEKFSTIAQRKELNFKLEIDPELPDYLLGDFQRTFQICYNLLDNAIKFTDIGNVALLFKELKSKDQSMLQIIVSDTGPGIAQHVRETIFTPFSAHDKLKKAEEGHGLGLAITRGLVSQMHGEIWATNKEDSGCQFVVQIPLNEAIDFEKNHIGTADNFSYDFVHKQVLLIEQDRADGISIAQALKQRNAYVNFYDDYEQGINQCMHQQFDCIIISDAFANADLMDLPQQFEQRNQYKAAPIFLLTSNIDDHFRQTCKDKGFAGLVSKPVNFHVLFNDLQQAMINFQHNRNQ